MLSMRLSILLLFGGTALSQLQTVGPHETFAVAKLSPKDIHEIIEGVQDTAFDVPDSWEKELRVRRVDLGGSRPGLVVRGTQLLCGATGNCQLWIFRRVDNKWMSLFGDHNAPVVESFQLGPSITHGIKDLTVVANLSAGVAKRVRYTFDGKSYRATSK